MTAPDSAAALATLTTYLATCDVPRRDGGPDEIGTALAALFTPDAVWEGVGPQYARRFGRVEGRDAVVAMLTGLLPPATHFRTNLHLLQPGTTETSAGGVSGTWPMQQLSRYPDGTAELVVAELTVDFRLTGDGAPISAFRTRRLFDAPLAPGGSG